MVATGIPPHITQIKLLKKMDETLKEVSTTMSRTVVDGVAQVLESRAIDAGEMTPDAVRRQILAGSQELLSEMRALVQQAHAAPRQSSPAPEQPRPAASPVPGAVAGPVYHWGGGYRLVPEGWQLP